MWPHAQALYLLLIRAMSSRISSRYFEIFKHFLSSRPTPLFLPPIGLGRAFFRERAIILPALGFNANQLDAIHYQGSIPVQYLCPLSAAIMTEPLYDPAHPQYKFESGWILQALKLNPQHPFTRTSLLPSELRLAQHLKAEIKAFVDAKRDQFAADPLHAKL